MNTRTQPGLLRSVVALALLVLANGLHAQVLIGTDGGTTVLPNNTISWSVGEPIIGTGAVANGILTQGFQQADRVKLRLNIAAFLEGPYNAGTGLMNDALRDLATFPLSEPFTAMGYDHAGGGGETMSALVLQVTGPEAIVDWLLVELRSTVDPAHVLESRSALLQRDGDVVAEDGVSPVSFTQPVGSYHVAVRHRNHLGAMTLAPVPLAAAPTTVDLTDGSLATYGTGAQKVLAGTRLLWAGDVTFDGVVKYTGLNNDRDPILSTIGGSIPTNTVSGYHSADVNMDGTVKYTGLNNDRDPILQNIGGAVPTNTRGQQVP